MNDPLNCFVPEDELSEAIKVTDITYNDSGDSPTIESQEVRGLGQLRDSLNNMRGGDQCRIMSVCQSNSWTPLEITSNMMDVIVSTLFLGPSLRTLATCFYDRDDDTEQTFCLPWTMRSTHGLEEVSYTIRYPEFKRGDDEWVIRQTGIYQIFDKAKSLNIYILLEPKPNSLLATSMDDEIRSHGTEFQANPFWLHSFLHSTYSPAWRDYMLYREKKLIPIADKTFSTFIEQPLNIGYEALSTLVGLKDTFSQALVILQHLSDTMQDLRLYIDGHLDQPESKAIKATMMHDIDNYERARAAQSRSATYLRQRTQDLIELLSHTLSLRDQVVAKDQNKNMIQLNKSAVFITAVALLYLPSSWLASFFGMDFFNFDNNSHNIIASSMIWIYAVASVMLTGATVVLYYFLLHGNGRLFGRLVPDTRVPNRGGGALAGLTRRLTRIRTNDYAMGELPK